MSNSNVKHTPGPWRYEEETQLRYDSLTGAPIERKAPWVKYGDGEHDNVAVLVSGDHINHEKNGRLIAAAPELLEALLAVQGNDRLMNALNNQDRKTLELIQSAILKATGGAE